MPQIATLPCIAVMRNLSARILLGFALLSVAFGFITGTILRNLSAVEEEVHTIRRAYLPIAFDANNFAQREEDLHDFIKHDPSAASAEVTLRLARERRNASFEILKNHAAKVSVEINGAIPPSVELLASLIDQLKPSYDQLVAALRRGDAVSADSVAGPLRVVRAARSASGSSPTTSQITSSTPSTARRPTSKTGSTSCGSSPS